MTQGALNHLGLSKIGSEQLKFQSTTNTCHSVVSSLRNKVSNTYEVIDLNTLATPSHNNTHAAINCDTCSGTSGSTPHATPHTPTSERSNVADKPCQLCTTTTPTKDFSILHNGPELTYCAACDTDRHALGIQTVDVVLGACGDQHCTDTEMVLAPTVSSQDKDGTHFVLRAVLTGSLARHLIDTGAPTSYVPSQFVNDSEQLTALKNDTAPISVRLGNNTVQIVKEQITTDMWIGWDRAGRFLGKLRRRRGRASAGC